jgi:hypothetical protein
VQHVTHRASGHSSAAAGGNTQSCCWWQCVRRRGQISMLSRYWVWLCSTNMLCRSWKAWLLPYASLGCRLPANTQALSVVMQNPHCSPAGHLLPSTLLQCCRQGQDSSMRRCGCTASCTPLTLHQTGTPKSGSGAGS